MKEENVLLEEDHPSLGIEEVSALLNELSDADRTALLTHLVSQSMDRATMGEILKAIAIKFAGGLLGLLFLFSPWSASPAVNETEPEKALENIQLELNRVA